MSNTKSPAPAGIPICPVCKLPAHAAESDDNDIHEECQRAGAPLWSTSEPLVIRATASQPYQLGTGRWFAVPTTMGLVTVDGDGVSEYEDDRLSPMTLAAFRAWLAVYDRATGAVAL